MVTAVVVKMVGMVIVNGGECEERMVVILLVCVCVYVGGDDGVFICVGLFSCIIEYGDGVTKPIYIEYVVIVV